MKRTLWPVPLPEFVETMTAFFETPQPGANGWEVPGYSPPAWFAGGAAILGYICKGIQADLGRKVTLMLPAYFCGQSLRHVRSSGVRLLFYPVDKELNPDYQWIIAKLTTEEVDVFLHVHYFGLIVKQDQSKVICDNYNIIMVEDCAHIAHPSVGGEWKGDYLFFSPHKYFPIGAGGVLYSSIGKVTFPQHAHVASSIVWFFVKLLRRWMLLMKKPRKKIEWGIVWSSNVEELPSSSAPRFVKNMTYSLSRDCQKLADCRLLNLQRLMGVLGRYQGWTPIIDYSGKSGIPFTLGMRCETEPMARSRYLSLAEAGCPVFIWPDLPSELQSEFTEVEGVVSMVLETIFFAIHDQISIEEFVIRVERALGEQ